MNVILDKDILDKLSPRGILAYVAVGIAGVKATPEKLAAAIRVKPDLIRDGMNSLMAAVPLQNLEKPKRSKAKAATTTFALPVWVDREAWDGYEEMRRSMKKPMTDRARSLAVNALERLEKLGQKSTDVLNQSTLNCYQGIFPLKEDFVRQQPPAGTKLKVTEFVR